MARNLGKDLFVRARSLSHQDWQETRRLWPCHHKARGLLGEQGHASFKQRPRMEPKTDFPRIVEGALWGLGHDAILPDHPMVLSTSFRPTNSIPDSNWFHWRLKCSRSGFTNLVVLSSLLFRGCLSLPPSFLPSFLPVAFFTSSSYILTCFSSSGSELASVERNSIHFWRVSNWRKIPEAGFLVLNRELILSKSWVILQL